MRPAAARPGGNIPGNPGKPTGGTVPGEVDAAAIGAAAEPSGGDGAENTDDVGEFAEWKEAIVSHTGGMVGHVSLEALQHLAYTPSVLSYWVLFPGRGPLVLP